MIMAKVEYALSACVDCLMWVANGELPEDDSNGLRQAIANNLGDDARFLCCGDGDHDDEFSWSACECCGSHLGGSRHQLVVLRM
jgi:hypothetical protein